MLSDQVKAAIRQLCEDAYVDQRAAHADDEYALGNIAALVDMMYELKVQQYEIDGPVLAVIWDEGYLSGSLHGIGPLALENPYD